MNLPAASGWGIQKIIIILLVLEIVLGIFITHLDKGSETNFSGRSFSIKERR
jgi:hypothetical protein